MNTFWNMIDHWQALVAGEIAIVAALVTVAGVFLQSRCDRLRKSRAARALMPAALSSVSDYTMKSVQWLRAAKLPATIIEADIETAQKVLPGPPPEPEARIFDILKDCVEHADAKPAQAIANLLSAMQIFRSRVWDIGDRITNPHNYSSVRALMGREADARIIDAINLRAMTDRLFPFARMETNKAPEPLDLNAVATAFKVSGLNEFQETEIWNWLTNPYLPKK